MYSEETPINVDRDQGEARSPPPPPPADNGPSSYERPSGASRDPPSRPAHAPVAPTPNLVLGVFGLSIRTRESDLHHEFSRIAPVEKVVVVYDQRSERSRGFGFVTMETLEGAEKCIQELNGMELHARRIRVDYSATTKAHNPTPGEYRGAKDYERRGYGGGDRWASTGYSRRPDDRWRNESRYGGGGGGYGGDRYGDRYARDDRYGDRYARGGYDRYDRRDDRDRYERPA
ncbi:hypothetical protein MNV49_000210 [Pseudohyphozyma bogoriensis]|nr:hypothetical protein MNV49_000210 [Pseudohyphozyma bogoriensis]